MYQKILTILVFVYFCGFAFGSESTESDEAVRNCVAELKDEVDVTPIEMIEKCLNLPEEIQDCLSENPPEYQDTLYMLSMECIPEFPQKFRDILTRIKNEELDLAEMDEVVSDKFDRLTRSQQKIMESRDGEKIEESMTNGSPRLMKFSKKFGIPMDYLESAFEFIKAEQKLQVSLAELDDIEKSLEDGPEQDALLMFYSITRVSSM